MRRAGGPRKGCPGLASEAGPRSEARPIGTLSARRGRHMDVPYETLTPFVFAQDMLIPAYNIFLLS
jgi:hypothetical protein